MGVLPIAQASEGFHRVVGQERAYVFQGDPLTGLNGCPDSAGSRGFATEHLPW